MKADNCLLATYCLLLTLPFLCAFAPACIATRHTSCIEMDRAARSVAGRSLREVLKHRAAGSVLFCRRFAWRDQSKGGRSATRRAEMIRTWKVRLLGGISLPQWCDHLESIPPKEGDIL